MRKQHLFLAVILCLLMIAVPGSSAWAAEGNCDVYEGKNVDGQNYYVETYGQVVDSYLTLCDDGTLMKVQHVDGTEGVLVEYYDTSYNFLRSHMVLTELPVFGGFYETEDYYFLLTGQQNLDESADIEVFRVSKYDKEWNRLGSVGLYDCNTVVPFPAGSARFADNGQYLLVRTCHQMYTTAYDGLRHQANITIQIDMNTMELVDADTMISGRYYGYISHSLNQFIEIENEKIVALDHGDAKPRSIVLVQYEQDLSTEKINTYPETCCTITDLMTFPGPEENNYTGATVGAFEISDTSYLVAGNSVVQDEQNLERNTKNIYVIAMDKSTSEIKTTWITDYEESEITTDTPQFVKLPDGTYLLLWSVRTDITLENRVREYKGIYYTKIDAEGNQIGDIYTMDGHLSDCVPIVSGDKLIWYTWENETNIFYEINLNQLDDNAATTVVGGHIFESTSVTEEGIATIVCTKCGYVEDVQTNVSVDVEWHMVGILDSGKVNTILGDKLFCEITSRPGSVEGDIIIEIEDPSIAEIYYHNDSIGNIKSFHSVGVKAVGAGSTKIKIYPKYNPALVQTYELIVCCKVTFDANGGTLGDDNASCCYVPGEPVGANIAQPEKNGYTFVGWYDQSVGGTPVELLEIKDNITLYAHWEKTQPVQVTGLSGICENNQVTLTWDDMHAVKYQVLRSAGDNNYVVLTNDATADGWIDADVLCPKDYNYKVVGYFLDENDNLILGEKSEAFVIRTVPEPPENIKKITVSTHEYGSDTVWITWYAPEGAEYFEVHRRLGAGTDYVCIADDVESVGVDSLIKYTDTGAELGTHQGFCNYKVIPYYYDIEGNRIYGKESEGYVIKYAIPTYIASNWSHNDGQTYYMELGTRPVETTLIWKAWVGKPGFATDNIVVEVDNPSLITLEVDDETGKTGKITLLETGTVTIKLYAEHYPEVFETCTLVITEPWVKVTYNANGGTDAPKTQEVVIGESCTLSSQIPKRPGYVFMGWYTESTGGEQITADTVFTENTTIYAQWKRAETVQVTNLRAEFHGSYIGLTWDDSNAVMYRVMRYTSETGYETLTFKETKKAYFDRNIVKGQLYYYRVCAYYYDENGNLVQGAVSAKFGLTAAWGTVPGKVENVSAEINDGVVTLTWDHPVDARYYKICRATGSSGGSYETLATNVMNATYVDIPVEAGIYRYKIVGYNANWTYGEMSNTLLVTVNQ